MLTLAISINYPGTYKSVQHLGISQILPGSIILNCIGDECDAQQDLQTWLVF